MHGESCYRQILPYVTLDQDEKVCPLCVSLFENNDRKREDKVNCWKLDVLMILACCLGCLTYLISVASRAMTLLSLREGKCVFVCVCLCVWDYGGTVMCANPVPCGHHFMLFSGWIINISEPCILVMFPGGVNGSDIDLKFRTPPWRKMTKTPSRGAMRPAKREISALVFNGKFGSKVAMYWLHSQMGKMNPASAIRGQSTFIDWLRAVLISISDGEPMQTCITWKWAMNLPSTLMHPFCKC